MYFVFFILLELGEWKIHAGNSTNSETSEYMVQDNLHYTDLQIIQRWTIQA